MAITETRPATQPPADTPETERFVGLGDHVPGGLAGFIGTGDHKSLGRAYMAASLFFGVVGVGLDALYRAHQASAFLPLDRIGQIFAFSRIALVLLLAVSFAIGLATYLIPLQVGSRTIAFPRAAAMAFWGWLIGSVLVATSFAIDGGPSGTSAKAVDLYLVAFALVIISMLLATVCVLTTVIALRTPGMRLMRIPMFAWSMVVAGSLWLLTLPVLLASLLLIYVDHHYGNGTSFGQGQWLQLSWAFGQPQVYVVAIPALGIVTDVLATLSGARQERRGLMMAAIAAFGILSFGAYVQPVYSPEIMNQAVFVAMGVLILLPFLALLAGWITTLRSGKPLLTSSLLFALGSVAVLAIALFGGALFMIKPLQLHDAVWIERGATPFADGQMLLVVAAATLASLGGLIHWAPKIFGRFAAEGLAKLAAVVALVGGLLAGLPLMVVGFSVKFDGLTGAAKALQGISAFGLVLMFVAIAAVVIGLLTGDGDNKPEADAWGRGQTLEWIAASPPTAADFDALDPVRSAEPLLDINEAQEAS